MLVSLYLSFGPGLAIRNRVDLRGVLLISRNRVSWASAASCGEMEDRKGREGKKAKRGKTYQGQGRQGNIGTCKVSPLGNRIT